MNRHRNRLKFFVLLVTMVTAMTTASVVEPAGATERQDQWVVRKTPRVYTEGVSIIFANNVFVAVGFPFTQSLPGGIRWSVDGLSWSDWDIPVDRFYRTTWHDVAYGNGMFVAIGREQIYGTRKVATSSDGKRWVVNDLDTGGSHLKTIAFGNGKFVAVGVTQDKGYQPQSARVFVSADGAAWDNYEVPAQEWESIAFGNGIFVAVAGLRYDYSRKYSDKVGAVLEEHVMTSPDGVNWTPAPVLAQDWSDVAFGDGRFVAVSNSSDSSTAPSPYATNSGTRNRVMTSIDGVNWVTHDASDGNWTGVTFASGQFIAVGWLRAGGIAMSSSDGTMWSSAEIIHSRATEGDVTSGNGLIVSSFTPSSYPGTSIVTRGVPNTVVLSRTGSMMLTSIVKPGDTRTAKWSTTRNCKIARSRLSAAKKKGSCTVTLRQGKSKKTAAYTVTFKVVIQ